MSRQMDEALSWRDRGMAEVEAERLESALDCFNRAVALAPGLADAHAMSAGVLQLLARLEDALEAYDRAIEAAPHDLDNRFYRANLLRRLKRHDEAAQGYEDVLAMRRDHLPGLFNLGLSQLELGDLTAALTSFERLSTLAPQSDEAVLARARALGGLGREDEAIALLATRASRPQSAAAVQSELGALLGMAGRSTEALARLDSALAVDPAHVDAHHNRGLILLRTGRFAEGFAECEWRLRIPGVFPPLKQDRPQWNGAQPLAGKTVLVVWEQGLGDTIQFCRYLPLLTELGARVIFSCQDRLHRLMTSLGGGVELIGADDEPETYDYVSPLLSLPLALGVDPARLPPPPYLAAEAQAVAHWRGVIGEAGFKIGIAWQGSRKGTGSGYAFPLAALSPLAAQPGVRLISLQTGEAARQVLEGGIKIQTLPAFDDGPDGFIDTAAVMTSLDLVITPDTSLAHLAGALGRPGWVALRHAADWRWLEEVETSPWYPSLRLFRQPRADDWAGVFSAMARALLERS